MQCRKLDRQAGAAPWSPVPGCGSHRLDCRRIGIEVASGIAGVASGLTQHVVGMGIAARFRFAAAVDCFAYRPSEDELPADDPHRLDHCLADHRFAAARHQSLQQRPRRAIALIAEADDATGQHQGPGGGVDEDRTSAEAAIPAGTANLLGDQPIGSGGIGNAQQRLGEAHQQHALATGQVVDAEKGVEAAGTGAAPANRLHQPRGFGFDLRACRRVDREFIQQRFNAGGFVGSDKGLDGAAERIRRGDRADKGHLTGSCSRRRRGRTFPLHMACRDRVTSEAKAARWR